MADLSDVSDPSNTSGAPGPSGPTGPVPSVAGDPGTLRFTGAYRVTTGPHGPIAVPGFRIELGERGITAAREGSRADRNDGKIDPGPGTTAGPDTTADLGGPGGPGGPGSRHHPDSLAGRSGPEHPGEPGPPGEPLEPVEPEWVVTWPSTTALGTSERSTLPDGRTGVVLVVGTRARGRQQSGPQRFVLPTDRPEQVEADLAALAAARGVASPAGSTGSDDSADLEGSASPEGANRRSRSRRAASPAESDADPSPPAWVVALTMPVVAAVVAVLLLAAGHQVHL